MDELICNNPGLLGFSIFILGLLIGNRLAILRDRRKERNEAAKPIREWLLGELETPSAYSKRPTLANIDLLTQYLPPWEKRKFLAAWRHQDNLRNESEYVDNCGQVFYKNEDEIRKAVSKCLRFTKNR